MSFLIHLFLLLQACLFDHPKFEEVCAVVRACEEHERHAVKVSPSRQKLADAAAHSVAAQLTAPLARIEQKLCTGTDALTKVHLNLHHT